MLRQQTAEEIDDTYQGFINMISATPATNEDHINCAFFLACAIKECMKHKDSEYIGQGYMFEKIAYAMRSIGIPIQEKV